MKTPKTSRKTQGNKAAKVMEKPVSKPGGIKLRKIAIKNYKAIDHLELEFPEPRMADDADVVVIGSGNGVGKTSVLEACVLLYMESLFTANYLPGVIKNFRGDRDIKDYLDKIIRSGQKRVILNGSIELGMEKVGIDFVVGPNYFHSTSDCLLNDDNRSIFIYLRDKKLAANGPLYETIPDFFKALSGFYFDPLVLPGLLYFHSYRRIKEGKVDLGSVLINGRISSNGDNISVFKKEILYSLMSRKGLFENSNDKEADESLRVLNKLMLIYAKGTVEKLRPSDDKTVELSVSPDDGSPSYDFDGLSSGQKEIISTLFLIWRYTKDKPGIVLIDEPELHLNAGWQINFIHTLYETAPWNQYIIATHSEDIFGSVEKDRRFLLVPKDKHK